MLHLQLKLFCRVLEAPGNSDTGASLAPNPCTDRSCSWTRGSCRSSRLAACRRQLCSGTPAQTLAGSSDALNATPALVAETQAQAAKCRCPALGPLWYRQADAPAAVATPEGQLCVHLARDPTFAVSGSSDCLDAQKPLTAQARVAECRTLPTVPC